MTADNEKPSRRSAAGLPVPTRPSVLVSHAPGVTLRFWLAHRRPSPLFRPAASLRSPPAARACRARPSPVVRPYATRVATHLHNPIIMYRYLPTKLLLWQCVDSAGRVYEITVDDFHLQTYIHLTTKMFSKIKKFNMRRQHVCHIARPPLN